MNNLSTTLKFLSKTFDGQIVTKNELETLVNNDKVSFESAASIVADIENAESAAKNDPNRSGESVSTPIDMSGDLEKMVGVKAVNQYFKDVKFNAMLENIKKDDTMLYTEYVTLEKAMEKIQAEIVQKEEPNFNTLLNEIKGVSEKDKPILDKLTSTRLDLGDSFTRV